MQCYGHREHLVIISAIWTARSTQQCGRTNKDPLCGVDGSALGCLTFFLILRFLKNTKLLNLKCTGISALLITSLVRKHETFFPT